MAMWRSMTDRGMKSLVCFESAKCYKPGRGAYFREIMGGGEGGVEPALAPTQPPWGMGWVGGGVG